MARKCIFKKLYNPTGGFCVLFKNFNYIQQQTDIIQLQSSYSPEGSFKQIFKPMGKICA
jgi:hypothetical protein